MDRPQRHLEKAATLGLPQGSQVMHGCRGQDHPGGVGTHLAADRVTIIDEYNIEQDEQAPDVPSQI
ncbi:hypothetical protein ACIBO2_35705 [Nonomuraea sp. NPDC050022]|uniref:hypothetical protein n=1 Tax=unclassified Nonomuraea TaxID=2593643 RepID=UPI00340F73DB